MFIYLHAKNIQFWTPNWCKIMGSAWLHGIGPSTLRLQRHGPASTPVPVPRVSQILGIVTM